MSIDSLVAVHYGIYPTNRVYHLSRDRGETVLCGKERGGASIVLCHQPDRVRLCKRCAKANGAAS